MSKLGYLIHVVSVFLNETIFSKVWIEETLSRVSAHLLAVAVAAEITLMLAHQHHLEIPVFSAYA
jgi:hypothetical protein